jgi:NADPH-dependent curcumin reductase CurA
MPVLRSREIRLARRPVGAPTPADFALAEADAPEPREGEIQVKNLWMSVDPYMRGRMSDRKSYVPPFELGAALEGGAVGEVVASRAAGFAAGDLVLSMRGWREAWTAPTAGVRKLELRGLAPQAYLGVAGVPGLTAYVGLKEIAAAKAGETVFVSAAAGAVGATACQIAKVMGCRVVGSAGSADKVAFLEEIGVDAAVNYREHPGVGALTRALAAAAPAGVDVYFENVGGDHLAAALNVMNVRGRVAVCGMISLYNDAEPQPGPANLGLIIGKRLVLRGFLVTDHAGEQETYLRDLARWIGEGRIVTKETVSEGIETAPQAFLALFEGGNVGKMLVRLA